MVGLLTHSEEREIEMTNIKCQMPNERWFSVPPAYCLLLTLFFLLLTIAPLTRAQTPTLAPAPDFESVIARQASLVSEFDVNGLKVLVKRREGSQTVATGLFIRG